MSRDNDRAARAPAGSRGTGATAAAEAAERFLLPLVLVAAAAGIAAPGPGRAAAAHSGIAATLAVLVLATGLTLRLANLAAAAALWRRLAFVLLVSTAALPALAWAAGLLIGDRLLRSGMLAAGVAPAEVATVGLCTIAGADAAVCAVLLATSTVLAVLVAGPVLAVAGAAVTASAAGLLGTLLLVVALPLAAGLGLRAAWSPGDRPAAVIRAAAVAALLALLWQVASQVRPDGAYLRVLAALAVFLAGSVLLGWLLSRGLPAGRATAVLLPVGLRDFAVAAGIAAAAYGPAAAAPLGGYGVLALLAGSAITQIRTWVGPDPPAD
jgi:predicted Na+-dependent transporter